MDLELLESLALSDDRSAALAQLLPGSEDHDYFRCLHAQHTGKLDEADTILESWTTRHGHDDRYERLTLRQRLYRLGEDPASVADDIRDHFDISHTHEAEVEEIDPTRPTKLAPDTFNGAALLKQALEYADLSQVTDEGLYELLTHKLDTSRRRAVLSRISHTPQPELVALIAADMQQSETSFGAYRIHNELTLEQLQALSNEIPTLRTNQGWIDAVIRRMRPPASVDLDLDRNAREAYLVELWRYVQTLPPTSSSLKVHVLWHLLDTLRQRNAPMDPKLFAAYLQLPRGASYVAQKWLQGFRSEMVAQLGADYRDTTGLTPARDDEELVRDLLHRLVANAEQFAQWLDRTWLDEEIAVAHLLAGTGDADRATRKLGPARAAALRERIDLVWSVHNPSQFEVDQPIVLEAEVKNVPELLVKVFRIDPIAYFQHAHREINTDLDLDGLAASEEIILRFTESPVRRVRRRIELPVCSRAGTYVVDLIGNGMSSRAVVHKGRLRHVARNGAAGRVVTILDHAGNPRSDARAWIGDREYTPDERGSFVVPFSTSPGSTPMLLSSGDIATVTSIDVLRESYALDVAWILDRQALTSGRSARAIARARLTVAGSPASLAAIKRTTWDVTITDRHGVATTKSQPLSLSDEEAAVLEFPLGEDTASVTLTMRGTVDVISEQREHSLEASLSTQIATMHGTSATEALYLAHTAGGWIVSALGKSGEPRAQRPITLRLVHRWAHQEQTVELATDAQGRVELGELPGIVRIIAELGGAQQTWTVEDPTMRVATLHVAAGQEAVVDLPPSRVAGDLVRRASLVELRAGVALRHPNVALESLDGSVVIRGLPPGEYVLRGPGIEIITIRVAGPGATVGSTIITAGEVFELPRPAPAIVELSPGDGLRVRLTGATSRTRVHVIATRFSPAPVESIALGVPRDPGMRFDRERPAKYVSGRELGDEYRYVLERRNAKRYPGLLLDKPSLLLNPWSRRATSTDVAAARAGGMFASSMAAPAPAGYGGRSREAAGEEGSAEAYVGYDFLPEAPAVIANLRPDTAGVISVPATVLGRATCVTVIVDDPAGTKVRRLYLAERPLEPRDLRLKLALDPARHASQQKSIAPVRATNVIVIEDLATAKIHLLDSIERAHAYLLALRDDATLREFAFVTRWHQLPDTERRELYTKYACHELHVFLAHKDRVFFDSVVKPYLAHKRTKTFVDHWLLGSDLSSYLEPAALARLNAVERALLAQRMPADDALPRSLADEVTIMPPNPTLDTHLIDALLGASTLDGDSTIEAAKDQAEIVAEQSYQTGGAFTGAEGAGGGAGPAGRRMAKKAMMPQSKSEAADEMMELEEAGEVARDFEMRREAAPMFRASDKTQEWAENNWWHLTPDESDAELIEPNRLWRDLAQHRTGGFLSSWFGLATANFAEAMCALAVVDLPFVAGGHAIVADGARLTITAAANALVGSSQLVDGELVTTGAPLVVGQSYVRADDRHRYIDGEQVDKYVEGAFAVGVVYTCQIVLANPTSSRQRIAALVQIPHGSIAVSGAQKTQTLDVLLEPYGTHGHEYSFYFPSAGDYTHFPVHVSRGGTIVAAAPARPIKVTAGGEALDPHSWPQLSQRGTLADVVGFLATANLASIDLERVAWRLRERSAYDAIISALERRRAFDDALWGYALLHHDAPRIRAWLRAQSERLLEAGPVLEMPIVELDSEWLGGYEYLEYAPLTNARSHRLGAKLRILNDGLDAQYRRLLDLVAHRRAPTHEDRLAAAAYLLAQDRIDPALAMLGRIEPGRVADRMQHDYLAAYAACLVGQLPLARELTTRWRELPVDRWRRKFEALGAMLDEVGGAAPVVIDPKSRDQQQSELASRQPAFEILVDRDGVVIRQQHVAALELRFFEMDVELLFSRQPFVQSDVSRFSFIEPGHRERLTNLPPEHRVPWPVELRGKNVVVEAVGPGQRKAKIHYANDLATSLSHQYGQVRVQRASDRSALPATYVKVYAQQRGGSVAFYKDGYTDLRGWFDYATLSTDDLDRVERFAILVCSDQAGSSILEASPPAR